MMILDQLCIWRGSIPPGFEATRTACAATSFEAFGAFDGGGDAGRGSLNVIIERDFIGGGSGWRITFIGLAPEVSKKSSEEKIEDRDVETPALHWGRYFSTRVPAASLPDREALLPIFRV